MRPGNTWFDPRGVVAEAGVTPVFYFRGTLSGASRLSVWGEDRQQELKKLAVIFKQLDDGAPSGFRCKGVWNELLPAGTHECAKLALWEAGYEVSPCRLLREGAEPQLTFPKIEF